VAGPVRVASALPVVRGAVAALPAAVGGRVDSGVPVACSVVRVAVSVAVAARAAAVPVPGARRGR